MADPHPAPDLAPGLQGERAGFSGAFGRGLAVALIAHRGEEVRTAGLVESEPAVGAGLRDGHAIAAAECSPLRFEEQGMPGRHQCDLGPIRGPAVGAEDDTGEEVGGPGAGQGEVERRRELAGPEDARIGRLVSFGLDADGVARVGTVEPGDVAPAGERRSLLHHPLRSRVVREHQAPDEAERRHRSPGRSVGHLSGDDQLGVERDDLNGSGRRQCDTPSGDVAGLGDAEKDDVARPATPFEPAVRAGVDAELEGAVARARSRDRSSRPPRDCRSGQRPGRAACAPARAGIPTRAGPRGGPPAGRARSPRPAP